MSSIILAGTARSGTTWLGQIIQTASGYPSVFEPLHPRYMTQAGSIAYKYLRRGVRHSEIERFFRKVTRGGMRNSWTDQENKGGWRRYHPRGLTRGNRIVKMVRANLMLDWLDETLNCPIIYMMRHPCAVAVSWKNLGWEPDIGRYVNQSDLVEDYIGPFMDTVKAASSYYERIAVLWCIENLLPLMQVAGKKWIVFTYEKLYLNAEEEVERILSGLDLQWNDDVNKSIMRHARSTNKKSAITKGKNPLTKWTDDLKDEDIKGMISILNAFGINIYNETIMPDSDALNCWIK